MSKNVYLDAFLKGLKPDPILSVSQWADQYRILPSKSSSEPGRWTTSRAPYLKEIMDVLSPNDPTEEVKVIKGTQLGFTEVGNNVILCYMDRYPCPIQMVMPNENLASKHSKSKLTASILAMPNLLEKVKDGKTKNDGGGIFEKEFTGGMFSLGWSNSVSSFASFSSRVEVLDDVDKFPDDVGGEGNPVALGKNRTDAFPNRKIYINGTPSVSGHSHIEREYDSSDQREYHMPCPHCKEYIVYDFNEKENLFKFEYDKESYLLNSDVTFTCKHCNGVIYEHQKTAMMDESNGAKYIALNPTHPHKGYRVNSFYSPVGWVSWKKIVMEYLEALKSKEQTGDVGLMKKVVNTRFARPFKEDKNSAKSEDILLLVNKTDPWTLPQNTLALVMSVDVQLDHFWFVIRAYTPNNNKHIVRYGRLENWYEIEDVARQPYHSEDGSVHNIKIAALDSGYNTQECYEFCAMNSDIFIPIKGVQKMQATFTTTAAQLDVDGKKVDTGLKLYKLNNMHFKEMLQGTINRSIKAVKDEKLETTNIITYHSECGTDSDHRESFAKQMTSEYKAEVENKRTGVKTYEWRTIGKKTPNHLWDCEVYNTFLGELLGVRFMKPEDLVKRVEKKRKKVQQIQQSDLDNY